MCSSILGSAGDEEDVRLCWAEGQRSFTFPGPQRAPLGSAVIPGWWASPVPMEGALLPAE